MERTCVGCRQRSQRADLLRVVEKSGFLIFDNQKNLPGRGAWLHRSCFQMALERKAFNRSFKIEGDIKFNEIEDYLKNLSN